MLDNQSERLREKGLTRQPCMVVVGPSFTQMQAVVVAVDKISYRVPTVQEAFDVWFKSFYVFDASFPPESKHLCYLFQRGLYKFETPRDEQCPYTSTIIGDLFGNNQVIESEESEEGEEGEKSGDESD